MSPVGQRIEMASEIGDELLARLVGVGVELGEAPHGAAPEVLLGARRGVAGGVDVEGGLERGDGAGEVAAEALPLLRGRGDGPAAAAARV